MSLSLAQLSLGLFFFYCEHENRNSFYVYQAETLVLGSILTTAIYYTFAKRICWWTFKFSVTNCQNFDDKIGPADNFIAKLSPSSA